MRVMKMFENEPVSESAKVELLDRVQRLKGWVAKYQVSNEPVSAEEVQEIAQSGQGSIFSLIGDWRNPTGHVNKVGFWLESGFWPGCDAYYQGKVAVEPGDYVGPDTELHTNCNNCFADDSQDPDEDCEACDGEAEIIFDLYWDENGTVTAERG
jgi:hypothetical protein